MNCSCVAMSGDIIFQSLVMKNESLCEIATPFSQGLSHYYIASLHGVMWFFVVGPFHYL